jgi:hypothetical protein
MYLRLAAAEAKQSLDNDPYLASPYHVQTLGDSIYPSTLVDPIRLVPRNVA